MLTLRGNRAVSREWIASTLWPERVQTVAFANLRPVLSELQRALGSEAYRLSSPNRATLLLDLDGAIVDLLEFDTALVSQDYFKATQLYKGPLLEGCPEEWAFQDRNAREQDCIRALHALGRAAYQDGEFEVAVEHFKRLVALDPFRDAPRRSLMRAYVKLGDVNSALHVYREFSQTLWADGSLAPDGKTTALYHDIRAAVRPITTPVRCLIIPPSGTSTFPTAQSH